MPASDLLVILPLSVERPELPKGVELLRVVTAGQAINGLLNARGDVVLCIDGLAGVEHDGRGLAAAVADVDGTVLEVRLKPWDGETHAPESAVSAGVIAGFGVAGVIIAVDLLLKREEQA